MIVAAVEAPPIKAALKCGGMRLKRIDGQLRMAVCDWILGVVPPELLDKGIEIICHKCDKRNVFD